MTSPYRKQVRILLTGAGALLGQGMMRALKRGNLDTHIIAADMSRLSAGLYWADDAYVIPRADSPDFIPSIDRLLAHVNPDVLLIGTDVELLPLALHRRLLEERHGVKILVSSAEVTKIADDKFQTASFFRDKGFAFPDSAEGDDWAGIQGIIEKHGFPLIVKPRIGARSYGVAVVATERELKNALSVTPHAVIQELIGGVSGQEYTASGLCFDGRCDAVIVMRRDLRDGNTYRAFSVTDSLLYAQVKTWTEALGPYGPVNFQFRISEDGALKVFEINARFSGTTPLRAHAGFNEVEMCVRKLMWNEPIRQPVVKPIAVLRHWSETVVEPEQIESIPVI